MASDPQIQQWLSGGRIIGKLSKAKFQWRKVNVVGNRCDVSDPKNPKKTKFFDLSGAAIVLIDSTKTLFQRYAKIPTEGRNPTGSDMTAKCFISITTPKAEKPVIFLVEHSEYQKWMSAFGADLSLLTGGPSATKLSTASGERPANIFIFGPPQVGKTSLTKRLAIQNKDHLGQPVAPPGGGADKSKGPKLKGFGSSSSLPKVKPRTATLLRVHGRQYRVNVFDFNSMEEMEQNVTQFQVTNTLVVLVLNIIEKDVLDKLNHWFREVKKMSRGGKSHLLVIFSYLDNYFSAVRGISSEQYCKNLIENCKSIWQDFGALTVQWRNLSDKNDIWASKIFTTCLENLLKEAPSISIKEKEEIKAQQAAASQVVYVEQSSVAYFGGQTYSQQQQQYDQGQDYQQNQYQSYTQQQAGFGSGTYTYQGQADLAFYPGGEPVGHVKIFEEAQFLVQGSLQGPPHVSIVCKDDLQYPYALVNHQDGQYTICHTPTLPGEYTVTVNDDNGKILKQFKIAVDPPANPMKSSVQHNGPMFTPTGVPASFEVHVLDDYGQPTAEGNVQVYFTGMDGTPVKHIEVTKTARPGEPGVYDVNYQSQVPGQFLKHVTVDGKPIQGEPSIVTFGSKSVDEGDRSNLLSQKGKYELKAFQGEGSKQYVQGKPNTFVVQVKDQNGKSVTNPDRVGVQFSSPEGFFYSADDIDVKVTSDPSGQLFVNYVPKAHVEGELLASILVDGVPLESPPIQIHTLRPLAQLSTIAQQTPAVARGEPTAFVVKLNRGDGKPVDGNVSVVFTDLHDNEVSGVDVQIQQTAEGEYTVTANYPMAGPLRAYVLLDGQPFMAPLEFIVEAPTGEQPADPNQCLVSGFDVETVAVGDAVTFEVTLLDANGNPTDGSFPEIIFGDEYGNMVEDIESTLEQVPGKKGVYTVSFSPKGVTLGQVALHITTDGVPIQGGPRVFSVVPGGADPAATTITPEVNAPAQVGKVQKFAVTVADKNGQPVPFGTEVSAYFTDAYGNVLPPDDFNVSVSPENNNQFVVSFKPEVAGQYDCHVLVDNVEVPGSPYHVNVQKAQPSALTSTAKGGPLSGQPLLAGTPSTFLVSLLDTEGRAASLQGAGKVEVTFTDAEGRALPANAITVTQGVEQDGVLPVTLAASNMVRGAVNALVKVNGQPINKGRPFRMDVVQPHVGPAPEHCQVKGLISEEGGVLVYAVQIADQSLKRCEKAKLKAWLEDVQGNPVVGARSNFTQAQGLDYHLALAADGIFGKRLCHVVCEDFEVAGSPFYISFKRPPADALQTQVVGTGVAVAKLGQPASFVVQLADKNGGVCEPGSNIQVLFGDEQGNKIEDIAVTIEPEENGQVRVTYISPVAGQLGLHVFVDGELTNGGNPFPVFIESDDMKMNSTEGTVNSESQFYVLLQDADGNPIMDLTPDVTIRDAEGNLHKFDLESHGDGSFTVKYIPLKEGQFFVAVAVDEQVIQEWPLSVGASVVSPPHCMSDWAQRELTINKSYRLKVLLMDDKGQTTTSSAPTSLIFCNGMDQEVPNAAVSSVDFSETGNGQVFIDFTPKALGQFKLYPRVNGQSISGAPFFVHVLQPKLLARRLEEDPTLPTIFQPSKFIINPHDEGFRDDAVVNVVFHDKDGKPLSFPVQTQKLPNGDVQVTYTPQSAGQVNMVVTLDGKPLQNQPFKLNVQKPKVDVGRTQMLSSPIETQKPAVVGGKTEFNLRLFDDKNQPLRGANIQLKFPDELDITYSVTSDSNGNYKIGVNNPSKPGDINFKVFVEEEEITNLPWRLAIKPAIPSALHCYIQTKVPIITTMNAHNELVLVLRDQYKNNVKVGNIKVMSERRTLARQSGLRVSRVHSRVFRMPTLKYYYDDSRETNIVSYSYPDIGDYNLHIFLDGEDIVGSPFHVQVKPQLTSVAAEVDQSFPRLLRFSGRGQKINVALVPLSADSLNTTDVFVLDNWNLAYQWSPSGSIFLGNKAITVLQALKESRNNLTVKVIDNAWNTNDQDTKQFWTLLGVTGQYPAQGLLTNNSTDCFVEPALFSFQGNSFKQIAAGAELRKAHLITPNQVFLLDTGFELHVWEGKGQAEQKASKIAETYVQQFKRPALMKVNKVLAAGKESAIVKHYMTV